MDRTSDIVHVEQLYFRLLDSWNKMNSRLFASLFAENGNAIGFDGSQMEGRQEIENQISAIFQDHAVASYVGIIRETRFLSPDVALLLAVAGMVPPGEKDINPRTNVIQTLITQRMGNQLMIVHYQNTPASFHGRPEASERLTNELQAELSKFMV